MTRIAKSELQQLIKEEVKKALNETVYGENAIVYHRTSVSDLVNKVYTTGFKPGGGDMYGKGFYATYDLSSQLRPKMRDTYGHIIVKFSCPTTNFFFFDWEPFAKTQLCKKLRATKEDFIFKQLDHFKLKYDGDKPKLGKQYTSDIALSFITNVPKFEESVSGIIFTGRNDGEVLVSYDSKRIVPLTYTQDEGKTWEKVGKNLEYIKKSFKAKSVSPIDLSNEKFKSIENYVKFLNNEGYSCELVNGKINVDGNIEIGPDHIKNSKIPFPFRKVAGDFRCYMLGLTSLKNAPEEVDRNFNCAYNELTTLEGAPKEVGGGFYCEGNELTTLEGAPKEVGGGFYCEDNELTTLEGAPKKVDRGFFCPHNKLTSLRGAPNEVGDFVCSYNQLTSLKGSPGVVYDKFICSSNLLTTLEGAPKTVGGYFDCRSNQLRSLEGAPKTVGGGFYCSRNKKRFKEEDVKAVSDIKGHIHI